MVDQTGGPRIGLRSIPLHPILVAIVPALFLFAENAVQEVTFDPLWVPLAISAGIGVGTLLASLAVLRDRQRAPLLATWLLLLFFSFGHAWNLVVGIFDGRRYLVAAYLAIGLLGALAIWRGRGWVAGANRALTVAAALLVAFNVVRIGGWAVGSSLAEAPSAPPPIEVVAPEHPRDIYYVILDRYANAETLRRLYGFDNTPFLDALRQRGFTVATDSWANYWKTAFSLDSSLSMDYLDGSALRVSDPPTFGPVFAALRDHLAVPQTLVSLGYEYVHIGNYWEPTATNVDAHLVLRYEEGSEFSSALWSTTALMLLSPLGRQDSDPETIQLDQDARGHALFGFDALEGAAGRPGPTYVFAHLLVPHPPYVFDIDGSMPTPEERAQRSEREEYVRQLQWTNQRVLAALDRMLDVPEDEQPIVILQADEGPWPTRFTANQRGFQWLQATPDEVQQKFGILNAFHLPGVDAAAAGVTDRISPVNEFRVVFDAYFGADLPLHPDVTYLSPDYAHMYDFVEYPRP
jgi:hypothetical protein